MPTPSERVLIADVPYNSFVMPPGYTRYAFHNADHEQTLGLSHCIDTRSSSGPPAMSLRITATTSLDDNDDDRACFPCCPRGCQFNSTNNMIGFPHPLLR